MKYTMKDVLEAIAVLEKLVEMTEETEKAVENREMSVPFVEEFEVEDLVIVDGDELGMIVAIDENEHVELPYLVRVGAENRWYKEEEIELADIDALLEEGEEELETVNDMKEELTKLAGILHLG